MATDIDELLNDSGTIIITKKRLIWILGLLFSAISAWSGYLWNSNVELNNKIDASNKEIIAKIEELRKEEIKPNTTKIFDNKYTLVYL